MAGFSTTTLSWSFPVQTGPRPSRTRYQLLGCDLVPPPCVSFSYGGSLSAGGSAALDRIPSCSVAVEVLVSHLQGKASVEGKDQYRRSLREGQTLNENVLIANIHLLIVHLSDWVTSCSCTCTCPFVADINSGLSAPAWFGFVLPSDSIRCFSFPSLAC